MNKTTFETINQGIDQAGENFHTIIKEIENYLASLGRESIMIPYTTRAWIAQRKD